MSEFKELIDLVQKVPRCVFMVERSSPKMHIPDFNITPTVHPKFITSHGPTRFRWAFKDPDEEIDYKGTVRWKTAVFLGTHSALIQYAFPYTVELPFRYDSDQGMHRFLNRTISIIRKADLGPFFVHNTLVRKGQLQRPEWGKDSDKVIDKIAFRDEVSAIIATGLLHSSVRLS